MERTLEQQIVENWLKEHLVPGELDRYTIHDISHPEHYTTFVLELRKDNKLVSTLKYTIQPSNP